MQCITITSAQVLNQNATYEYLVYFLFLGFKRAHAISHAAPRAGLPAAAHTAVLARLHAATSAAICAVAHAASSFSAGISALQFFSFSVIYQQCISMSLLSLQTTLNRSFIFFFLMIIILIFSITQNCCFIFFLLGLLLVYLFSKLC